MKSLKVNGLEKIIRSVVISAATIATFAILYFNTACSKHIYDVPVPNAEPVVEATAPAAVYTRKEF